MKATFIGLILAAILNGASAKKYYNRELEKADKGLFGPGVSNTYESHNKDEDSKTRRGLKGPAKSHRNRRKRGRRLSSSSKSKSSSSSSSTSSSKSNKATEATEAPDDDPNEGTDFYRAETLDYFRNGIDPELFEWVNPDEIVPGSTTCGFLKPRLGSLDDVIYPTIEVYVCMRFADTQPASKGNLFLHCGGPGSLTGCMWSFVLSDDLTPSILNDYNLLTIDQVS